MLINLFWFLIIISTLSGKYNSFLIYSGYRPSKHQLAKYIVSFRKSDYKHFCAGSIIFPKIILTAAHCVYDENPRKIKVVVGTPFLYKKKQTARFHAVDRVLIHPYFNNDNLTTYGNDIALVYLKRGVVLDDESTSIVPLIDEEPKPPVECVTYGWGRLFYKGPRPDELLYVNLTLLPFTDCSYSMISETKPYPICVKDSTDDEKGIGAGDSGGPLICNEKLTGITSTYFHFGVKTSGYANGFTNIWEHRNWISENSAIKFSSTSCVLYNILLTFYF